MFSLRWLFVFHFKEIKEELENLNKEIKKTANKIRVKLKCELKLRFCPVIHDGTLGSCFLTGFCFLFSES